MTEYRFAQFSSNPKECPNGPHRGPQGPNEDLSQCGLCLMPSYSMRPRGETFGNHLPDCSLPIDHESFCVGGGDGHPEAEVVRG
jgi:hypothetical protein